MKYSHRNKVIFKKETKWHVGELRRVLTSPQPSLFSSNYPQLILFLKILWPEIILSHCARCLFATAGSRLAKGTSSLSVHAEHIIATNASKSSQMSHHSIDTQQKKKDSILKRSRSTLSMHLKVRDRTKNVAAKLNGSILSNDVNNPQFQITQKMRRDYS